LGWQLQDQDRRASRFKQVETKPQNHKTITMDFYIVNEIDRPCEQHIAEMRGDGKFYYIHPELRDVKSYHGMTPSKPVKLSDFGIEVDITGGLFHGIQSGKSIAQYPESGKTRHWQGLSRFSFRVTK
jgi:hypothetical protein